MKTLLSFTVALAAFAYAGPLFAQSCCNGVTATPAFGSPIVQPVENFLAPVAYTTPVSNFVYPNPVSFNAATTCASCSVPMSYSTPITYSEAVRHSAPINYSQQITYSAPIVSPAYSTPMSESVRSIATNYSNTTSTVPLIATPIVETSASSAATPVATNGCAGCGCGCSKTVPCKCDN